MDKETDAEKRKKARARKKALAIPIRDKMMKSPPICKTAKEVVL